MAHCSAMIYQQVTLSGDAEWPKVADAVIEARSSEKVFFNVGGSTQISVFRLMVSAESVMT